MTSQEFERLSTNFSRIAVKSSALDLRTAANLAERILVSFNEDRSLDANEFLSARFDLLFNCAESAILDDPVKRIVVLESMTRIAGAASFIKWKKVSDLERDNRTIFESYVLPFFTLELASGGACRPQRADVSPVIVYLPNVSPFASGIANAVSAREIISAYSSAFEAGFSRLALYVGVSSSASRLDLEPVSFAAAGCPNFSRGFTYKNYSTLVSAIRFLRPSVVVIDYFTFPWNFLPRLFPSTRFIYKSFGFHLFLSAGCSFVIGGSADCTFDRLIGFAQRELAQFKTKVRSLTVPRIRVPRVESGQVVDVMLRAKKAIERIPKEGIVLGTLCRGTKISREYVDIVSCLLRLRDDVFFAAAGVGVRGTKQLFPEELANRVFLFDSLQPDVFLSRCDIYLETFPEHQGLAVIEAIECRVPVISLDSDEFKHTLLNERYGNLVVSSQAHYIQLAQVLVGDAEARIAAAEAQIKILDGAYATPIQVWEKIEAGILDHMCDI
jgi:glycosyltransferase involved in cell wall biosynthesis